MSDNARKELRWQYFTSVNSLILMVVLFIGFIALFDFSPMAVVIPPLAAFFYADSRAQERIKE